ncbi:MAG: biotin/lipoyl-binding protein [Verrucomicrobiota bacterium]
MISSRFSLLAVAGLVIGLTGCKKAAPPALPPPIVEVVSIKAENAPASTGIIGQLDSPQNVEVRARVEAFVDKMLFTEGTEVKEGDPLFKLDDKPFKERLAAAEGALAQAKAMLNKYDKDVARLTPLAGEARHSPTGSGQRARFRGKSARPACFRRRRRCNPRSLIWVIAMCARLSAD